MDFRVFLFLITEDRPELLELGILGMEWPYCWTNREEGFLLQNLNMSFCSLSIVFSSVFLRSWNKK